MSDSSDELVFFVNGRKICIKDVEPETTLVAFLRRHVGLTGTKQSCNEGSCGACTVMVSDFDRETNHIRHKAITSCMVPLCTLHGLAVTTIEGIGNIRTGLHPVQERIVKFHGTQCGFCTPGMVMTMYTLLRNNPEPTKQEIIDNLHGNICRCTGYRSIVDAFGTFAKDEEYCCQGTSGSCCQDTGTSEKNGSCCQATSNGNCCQALSDCLTDVTKLSPFDPTQKPIFPPELQIRRLEEKALCIKGERVTWYRPCTLAQALQVKSENPTALVASGCTALAQELKKVDKRIFIIDVSGLRDLKGHEMKGRDLILGAGLSLTELVKLAGRDMYKDAIILQAIPRAVESMGSQLKNSASLGGHIMLRKPVHDLIPLLVAGNCSVVVASKDGRREIPLTMTFFSSRCPLSENEILIALKIPCSTKKQHVCTNKVAKRKKQSFASLNAAILLDICPSDTRKIDKARIVFGGQIPGFISPVNTETFLAGRIITEPLIKEANKVLHTELSPPDHTEVTQAELSPPKSICLSETQVTWAQGFLYKCLQGIILQQKKDAVPAELRFRSRQIFEINKDGEFSQLTYVGQPITHNTAEEQVSGEAVFIDDISTTSDELFVYPVLSSRAHAKLIKVDLTKAMSLPGVHGYIDHNDVPGVNYVYPLVADEEFLATDTVHYCGQTICGIVAKDRETAMRAASRVEVTYEDLSPVILTIEDAIKAKSFMGNSRLLSRGDLEEGLKNSDYVTEGKVFCKGQKHIYLEMVSALAVPKERNEMEVFCNTQMGHVIQLAIGDVLGISAHNVSVRVKRLGGGFGGKESPTSSVSLLAAVAANKLRRPVRCVQSAEDDTIKNGGRHPCLAQYKVGFTKEGKIQALELKLFVDGGVSLDITQQIVETMLICADTCYNIPNLRVEGQGCRTNLPSNTAFRGFGKPQSYWIMENIIIRVAAHLSLQPEQIQERHLYRKGDTTLSSSRIEDTSLVRCWEECKKLADFDRRKEQIHEFNRVNCVKKRGIAMQPVVFGIGFYGKFLNQAGALVNIYTDGSVMVTHGGCEMGQGLHTKIKQIACDTLGVDYHKVLVSEYSSKMVPNATFSAGSVTTDLNGGAVHDACLTLLERLKPYRQADPDGGWDKWVNAAYFDRVSLSATGFFKMGDFGMDFTTGKGPDCHYYTCGAGCSEVEVDSLTGEHKVIRTDIVMDVGRSINPAIDIGQIEGGFMMGYGFYMMEDVVYDSDGQLLTDSPNSYKVPLVSDLPAQFNVALLKNSINKKAIYSSKGIGEPPFLLSLSAYLAAHKAVLAVREQHRLTGPFNLSHPATPANVLQACRAQ